MLMISALALSGTALHVAQDSSLTALASSPSIEAELISPASYEQHLNLVAPIAVAVAEGSVAIADGNTLYVYDKADNVYRTYTHTSAINKIEFDGEGNLYFLSAPRLYKLTAAELKNGATATEYLPSCMNFTIDGDTLYYCDWYAAVKYRSLSQGIALGETLLSADLTKTAPLAFGNDFLYCVCENPNDSNVSTVYAINPIANNVQPLISFSENIRSIAVAKNLLCIVTDSGNFYTYNHTELQNKHADEVTSITKDEGGYVSLCAYENGVYTIRNNIVREYLIDIDNATFTDYEIGAGSASPHRLNGATDVLLNENRLFIADNGNQRISVYNTDTGSYETAITSTLPTPFLSSYGNTLLVSSEEEVALYSLSSKDYGTTLLSLDEEILEGNVIGATAVYDHYYVLTDSNYCYALTVENGTWSYTETLTLSATPLRATAFTSDVYGSLYVAYDNNTVYRFTEKELLTADASGAKILEGFPTADKLTVDYEGSLYALTGGTITKYTAGANGYTQSATYAPDYGLVYDNAPNLISFTFGVESPDAYLLYANNYIIQTNELQIPIVNPIPVGNAANVVFGEGNAEFSVVTVAEDTVLIEFDMAALKTAVDFPYVAFKRISTAQSALKLGTEGGYAILAMSESGNGKYKSYLAVDTACSPLTENEYQTTYETPKVGYLTNAVSVYKYPFLNELLTHGTLSKQTPIQLLGETIHLDHAYYKVAYTLEDGTQKTGYIPQPFVTLSEGATPSFETLTYGETESDEDRIWRAVYILLGLGVIGILVDVLLLRKPKQDNEEE